jgi:hypothetical protein
VAALAFFSGSTKSLHIDGDVSWSAATLQFVDQRKCERDHSARRRIPLLLVGEAGSGTLLPSLFWCFEPGQAASQLRLLVPSAGRLSLRPALEIKAGDFRLH